MRLDVRKLVCYGTATDDEGHTSERKFSSDPEGLNSFMDGLDEAGNHGGRVLLVGLRCNSTKRARISIL